MPAINANQKLSTLRALWERKCSGRAMPARAEFDVGVLKPWLGNLALIDIPSNMIRLCGTSLMSRFGRDATGRNIASLDKVVAASLMSGIDCARTTKSPTDGEYRCIVAGYLVRFQELVLPLSDDGIEVTTILLGSFEAETRPAWQ
ncbi:MAG: PAS domain-containing protein [Rhizomicrobium sp.]